MGEESFDITVIGGGISGVGVARECAHAGFKVLLVEKNTLGSATSANSLRIIHGGFRYLQNLDVPRVLESIRDQNYWLQHDPDLVVPLPCLMPLEAFSLKSSFPTQCAAYIFGALRKLAGPLSRLPNPKVLNQHQALEHCQLLEGQVPHGALLWHDARLLDPQSFLQRRRKEIESAGGIIRENTAALNIRGENSETTIRLSSDAEIKSKVVVATMGPWFGNIESDSRNEIEFPRWCKAFNVVIDSNFHLDTAISLSCDEKRLLFLVPREPGKVALGTWYLPFQQDPKDLNVSIDEAAQLVECFTKKLGRDFGNISKIEAGILPARCFKGVIPCLYGSERIFQNGRVIEVLSTKYTTFRSQALKVVALAKGIIGPKMQGKS